MKWVSHVQTRDGELHRDVLRATTHAEKVYGEALSRLAHRAVAIQKYSGMQEFIDANLDAFIELRALRDDITLQKSDNDTQNDSDG